MMKLIRNGCFIVLVFAVFFISNLSAHAELYVRGTDSLGNQLIYDSDLNITWYDYTKNSAGEFYQRTWADTLTVAFNGTDYNDWRLPTTTQPDPSCSYQETYGGAGFNCTNSEMGHLYYVELENVSGGPLTNTGDFQNLSTGKYWSGTVYPLFRADWFWSFDFNNGYQYYSNYGSNLYAIAVRDGDIAVAPPVVPEPISSILFVTGGALLVGRALHKKKKRHNPTLL